MLKHKHLPLSLELAKLFCLSNNIYNEQCPTQIIRKVIFDNQLTFSAAQIKAILKNNYFSLETKLDVFKLSQKENTKHVNYKILSFMNENQCYTNSNTSKDDTGALQQQFEITSTSSVETSQATDT